jgi:hypothetical protein
LAKRKTLAAKKRIAMAEGGLGRRLGPGTDDHFFTLYVLWIFCTNYDSYSSKRGRGWADYWLISYEAGSRGWRAIGSLDLGPGSICVGCVGEQLYSSLRYMKEGCVLRMANRAIQEPGSYSIDR